MDRNTIIGFSLIFILLMVFSYVNSPSEAELEREQFLRDSIARVEFVNDSLKKVGEVKPTTIEPTIDSSLTDSARTAQFSGRYGVFAPAASGKNQEVILENDVMKIVFNTYGGNIKEVWLKEYKKWWKEDDGSYTKLPLKMLEDQKNKFEYILPVAGAAGGEVYTSELYFNAELKGTTLSLKAPTANGYFEQVFTLKEGDYLIDYDLNFVGLGAAIPRSAKEIKLHWVNFMDKLEKYAPYEASYSTVYFKENEDDPTYCSCRGDDEATVEKPLKWVSHAQQFFNSSLIADNSFSGGEMTTVGVDPDNEDLKQVTSTISIPVDNADRGSFEMQFYIGPNKYNELKSYGIGLQEIIPFGWSIFGWVNRNIILPLFNFLGKYIGNYGILILVLTIILKTVLFPLQYKMLYSQMKMRVLKPDLAKLKEKYKDDQQAMQMEQMKLYRETGASPFSGCLPIFMQMPVWIALYRFFPAAIEFRQEPFLWATDLSTYDSLIRWGTELPILGDHLSLFTILWVISTILYTYYNSKDMDFSAQPMMKYIQYFMPLMFIFIFNNYASGLTAYLFMSSLINISQIIITKNFIIDIEKVKKEMDAFRKKPKKKSGFQERIAKAMAEQQKQQAKIAQDKAKKKKKK